VLYALSVPASNGKICAVRYETGITLKRIQFDETRRGVTLQLFNKDFQLEFIDADQSQWLTMIVPLALQLRFYYICKLFQNIWCSENTLKRGQNWRNRDIDTSRNVQRPLWQVI
jgi:hypothetical protein